MAITILLTHTALERHGGRIERLLRDANAAWQPVLLPEDPAARLDDATCAGLELALFSEDVFPDHSRSFFSATQRAPALKWLHVFNAGTDNPVFRRLLERGVRITTSSGTTAQPIAQSAIAGVLMLSRGFPRWLEAQRRHAWEPLLPAEGPADLAGQRMVVVGLGAIGNEIARIAGAIGLDVSGIRRSAMRAGDNVREVRPPAALRELLPQTQWLVLACPLTAETRGLIGDRELALLPRDACLVNIARGEVVHEQALVAALRANRLRGAYLDVFEVEPLPAESPLWEMPNVIVTPHNSGVAAGNAMRAPEYFFRNLAAWLRGEPMENEVRE